ncbi:zinc-finger domain-containing protein [Acidihalobacter ferrooxydans]|uniref:Zinc finger CHCC-type domain-containing protein n=1 Tax=Acidihalobacter ferrooxydans TaxID=1765967 RepID=A0A1P8UJ67_9GAMM|nr:zinc-finger domain-containing protein [Acidihalobacter ferrooxydans]APZ43821.1 hypothetical protein BW247_12580 [Acidihalobacter ferrooxydans]
MRSGKHPGIDAPSGGAACAPAATERVHRVRATDLPVSCPLPEECLWNAHPKVYLPLSAEAPQQVCPYCGTRYILDSAAEPTGQAPAQEPESLTTRQMPDR